MKPLSAFVGHSFSEEDAIPIATVLKYLDGLSELLPGFSWVHAESAEPRLIDEKVLRLIKEKNLFIGICTRKERVGAPSAFSAPLPWLGSKLRATDSDLEWKTSDWIIQEVGLAIGLGLDVILLVENGVRSPGGLQGSLEYIPFDRGAPERCFTKLVQMISALSPRALPPESLPIESAVSPQPGQEVDLEDAGNWAQPSPEWNARQYRFAVMHFLAVDKPSEVEKISEVFLKSGLADAPDAKIEWEAHLEFQRLSWGMGGNLTRLMKLSESAEKNSVVANYLGQIYRDRNEHGKAASAFIRAAQNAKSVEKEIECWGEAACQLHASGDAEGALRTLVQLKARSKESGIGKLMVLAVEKKFSELRGETDFSLGASERMSDIDPADNDIMFSLGYTYSERGDKELAAFHYARIPFDQRSSGAWNNLALEQGKLDMPAKSVQSLRQAVAQGETLASSNLADKFISAGFLPEAQAVCDEALKVANYHKNLGTAISRLKSTPGLEDEREQEIAKRARPTSGFYRRLGEALTDTVVVPASDWLGKKCTLHFVLEGEVLRMEGDYEQSEPGIAAGLMMFSGSQKPQETRIRITYSGKIRGRAITAKIVRKRDGERMSASTLMTAPTPDTALMVISEDLKSIEVLERSNDGVFTTYTLLRV